MFLKKSSQNEFAAELEHNLDSIVDPLKQLQRTQTAQAVQHLLAAAEILDELQLYKQAAVVTDILEKFADQKDLVENTDTTNITPEQEVSNLKQYGMPLVPTDKNNAEILDVAEPKEDESVVMKPDGEIVVTDNDKAIDKDIDSVELDIADLAKKPPSELTIEDLDAVSKYISKKNKIAPYSDDELIPEV